MITDDIVDYMKEYHRTALAKPARVVLSEEEYSRVKELLPYNSDKVYGMEVIIRDSNSEVNNTTPLSRFYETYPVKKVYFCV